MEEKHGIVYLIYDIRFYEEFAKINLPSSFIENDLRNYLENFNILNLIFPLKDQQVFITIDSKDVREIPEKIKKNYFYDLTRLPKNNRKIPEIYFQLNTQQIKALCGNNVDNVWDMMSVRYALNVKEFIDSDDKNIYLLEGDIFQYSLLNKILENIEDDSIVASINDDESLGSISTISRSSKNELVFDFNGIDLTVEIRKGNIFNEQVDVIVIPVNPKLELNEGLAFEAKKRGGEKIQMVLKKYLTKNRIEFLPDGDIVATKKFNIQNTKYIFYLVIGDLNSLKNELKIAFFEKAFFEIFAKIKYLNSANSVSLPFLTKDIPIETYCDALKRSMQKLARDTDPATRALKKIKILIDDDRVSTGVLSYFEACTKIPAITAREEPIENQESTISSFQPASIKKFIDLPLTTDQDQRSSIELVINTDEQLIYLYNPKDIRIEITNGNLVDQIADVIAIGTNSKLQLTGPLGNSIKNKAGYEITQDCESYMRRFNLHDLKDSEVVVTKSYKMTNCRRILHAIGPNSNNYKDTKYCRQVLQRTFLNILLQCEKMKASSVALPLISSGSYGVPKELCCEALYKALEEYLQSKDRLYLKCIKITSIDFAINSEIIKYFKERLEITQQVEEPSFSPEKEIYAELTADELVSGLYAGENDTQHCSRCNRLLNECDCLSRRDEVLAASSLIEIIQSDRDQLRFVFENTDMKVEIYDGDLVEQMADVIVNAANDRLVLGGGVAGAINDKTGNKVQDECNSYLKINQKRRLSDAEVMHTNSYMKNCSSIIHAVGPNISNYNRNENQCYNVLEAAFLNVFEYAEETLKARSMALPLISSGIFGVPKEVCCERLYSAIQTFINITSKKKKQQYLKCIKIVSIDKNINSDIIKYFKKQLSIQDDKIESKPVSVIKSTDADDLKTVELNTTKEMNELIIEGKCILCEQQTKLKLVLPCGCKYCKSCSKNYIDNDNKCECPDDASKK